HSRMALTSATSARSADSRTSPWTNSTPASRSRTRLSSDPRRRRLSKATTLHSGLRCARATATFAPTKPAPPVTRTLTRVGMVALARGRSRRGCGQLRPADEERDAPERDQSIEGELDDEDQTERPDLHREHWVMNQVDEDVERENRHADPD